MSEVSKSQVLLTVFSYVLSWFMGRRPEYTDPKVVAQGEGREGKLMLPAITEGLRWVPNSPGAQKTDCVKVRELPDNWDLVIYKTPKEFSRPPLTQVLQWVVCHVCPSQIQLMLSFCPQ